MRFLVVDDEVVSRKKMQRIMSHWGDCVVCASGPAAVETFEKALDARLPFDAVTLDVGMPDMDGTAVLKRIREIEHARQVAATAKAKIIMVTSHAQKDIVLSCIQAGCSDYVVKPFNRETIAAKLNSAGLPVDTNRAPDQTPDSP